MPFDSWLFDAAIPAMIQIIIFGAIIGAISGLGSTGKVRWFFGGAALGMGIFACLGAIAGMLSFLTHFA